MLPDLYIDHLVFRVQDIAATEAFYNALFGEALFREEDVLMYQTGETRLFFTTATQPPSAPYDKEQPGLNHLAFGVHGLDRLHEILNHLNNSGLRHSGIRTDPYGNKEFIWLDDPNGFRLEFYCRPTP